MITGKGGWSYEPDKQRFTLRSRVAISVFFGLCALLVATAPLWPSGGQSQDGEISPLGHFALFLVWVGLLLLFLWASAVTCLVVDLKRRYFEHTRRWFSYSQVKSGPLHEPPSVCTSMVKDDEGFGASYYVCIVLRIAPPPTRAKLHRLESYSSSFEAEMAARDFAMKLGLPVVPEPQKTSSL